MKRLQCTSEFKREAARLLIMDGLSASTASVRLDWHVSLLSRWKLRHLSELDAESDQQPPHGLAQNAPPRLTTSQATPT